MKIKELTEMKRRPSAEIEKKVSEHRETLWNLKKDLAGGKVKNVRQIRSIKRTIAQLLTILKK